MMLNYQKVSLAHHMWAKPKQLLPYSNLKWQNILAYHFHINVIIPIRILPKS